jgi:hypothetical protein
MTLPEYLAKITLEEDNRTHNIEVNNPERYKKEAYEDNTSRAVSMDYPTHRRRVLVRSLANLRHREFAHGEVYEDEKAILTSQMLDEDIAAVEEGVTVYGWWNI